MEISTINTGEKEIQQISDYSKSLPPSYRIVYFPQDLTKSIWETIFKRKLNQDLTQNTAYLRQLNRKFEELGPEKSHAFLNEVEKNNKDIMNNHYTNLKEFIFLLKKEFIKGIEAFDIQIEKGDTTQKIIDKIDRNEKKIKHQIRKNWNIYKDGNPIYISPMNDDLVEIQLGDMTYVGLEYIKKDTDFLEDLIKRKQNIIGKKGQKIIGKAQESIGESIID